MAVRHELAVSSIHMAATHPWFGVGLGTWSTVYPRYALLDVGAFANQAHNDWLQWAAEGGIPFGIILATLFFWCLRPAIRSIWGVGVIAVFLHAIVDYPFSRPALGSWPRHETVYRSGRRQFLAALAPLKPASPKLIAAKAR
jgi:O-antigen ligase